MLFRSLHERFREKLAVAKSQSTLELDGDWSALEAIFADIFGVFHDLSAREILAFTRDYYEVVR